MAHQSGQKPTAGARYSPCVSGNVHRRPPLPVDRSRFPSSRSSSSIGKLPLHIARPDVVLSRIPLARSF